MDKTKPTEQQKAVLKEFLDKHTHKRCMHCSGTGKVPHLWKGFEYAKCVVCNGRGFV